MRINLILDQHMKCFVKLFEEFACRVCSKTPSQVLLKWALQKGLSVIPKSCQAERIRDFGPQNFSNWTLKDNQMRALEAIEDDHRYCWNSDEVL